jgi:hypothetical protein
MYIHIYLHNNKDYNIHIIMFRNALCFTLTVHKSSSVALVKNENNTNINRLIERISYVSADNRQRKGKK